MKKIIAILLILIGIIVTLTSFGLKMYSKSKEKALMNHLTNELKLENKKETPKKTDVKDNNENEIINLHGAMAIIEIPSIGLKSVIVEGTEMEKLRYYIGHFKETALPGQLGNFCIAGHSSSMYSEILNNLHKVKIGDEIKIKTIKEEFNYKIKEKFVVDPTKVSVLNQDKTKRSMTIVTCTDNGKNRLIVKGEINKNDK
ncbi:sortase [Clostridium tetani]|uniref:class D sortase n=1 Tax=Clostridium tetani TaxID=1513 RepID=UPI000D2016A7|nr:class D sortase [Clostridium tetani]AVP53651.1 class D sortase [Clostridium tetani]RXI75509.1 class D sortase [Clostridium tetani]RXM68655.1 class D sortase [Clostridium tetani]WFN63028.1 class D sortase [Clostridium tetani]SUY55239.1 sortase [Clostridium tetani]